MKLEWTALGTGNGRHVYTHLFHQHRFDTVLVILQLGHPYLKNSNSITLAASHNAKMKFESRGTILMLQAVIGSRLLVLCVLKPSITTIAYR